MPRNPLALALALSLLFPLSQAEATTRLLGSTSCTNSSTHTCITIDTITGSAPVRVHSAVWSFPAAGVATVTWQGSMQCVNYSFPDDSGAGVADLAFVVTRSANDPVNHEGRNGFRAAMQIPPVRTDTDGQLAATFPVTISASLFDAVPSGSNTYYLKMRILRLDQYVRCIITNGSFTGIFNTQ